MYSAYSYDLFISHAVEDKIPFVNELVVRLEAEGIKVWYTGQELSMGDVVCNTLVAGMQQCRHGIVIFSASYISKLAPSPEFNTLLAYKRNNEKVIIPILFDVTQDQLAVQHILIDRGDAIYTTAGLDDVVNKLRLRIGPIGNTSSPQNTSILRRLASRKGKLYAALLFVIGVMLALYGFSVLLA